MRKLKTHELKRLDKDSYKTTQKIPLIVILDNIRSMHNVGAVFRTADAFLIEKLILCGITPKPPHRDIHKTALGATESVEWTYSDNICSEVKLLKSKKRIILGIEQVDHKIFIEDFKPDRNKKYAIILGNEVNGLSDSVMELLDNCLEIPQMGTKHSLNISVAAGISMYHFFRFLQ
jgi:23S rRNA (guanosine2251-2'-O)-methyltransferase